MNTSSSPKQPARTSLWVFVVAFSVWAALLAIGATGVFTDIGLFDLRRSLIVLGCSAVFLGFWCWVFTRPRSDSTAPQLQRSFASPASLMVIGAGYLCWGAAWFVWRRLSDESLTNVLSWLSLLLMAVATIMALVGLSDPRPKRLKLMGLGTLLMLGIAVVTFMFQAFL